MKERSMFTKTRSFAIGLLISTAIAGAAHAEVPSPTPVPGLPAEFSAVASFYQSALTVNAKTTASEVLATVLSDSFQSVNIEGIEDRAALTAQIEHFWTLVPNLRWDIQEVIVAGDQVVVRSIASGSPKGNFFGLELDGSKSFRIDTIDIHTLRDGKIETVHHVEGWATAMQQLTAK